MPLTDPKWEAFARSVASGQSKRQAAISAGYGIKDASSRGSKLARKSEIGQRIAELHQTAATVAVKGSQITKDYVISRLKKNLERSMGRKYNGNVANRALELLGKEIGMFVERKEVTGKDGAAIQVTITSVEGQL